MATETRPTRAARRASRSAAAQRASRSGSSVPLAASGDDAAGTTAVPAATPPITAPASAAKVRLEDLSRAERGELLAAAREEIAAEQRRNVAESAAATLSNEDMAAIAKRQEWGAMLEDRDHVRACPAISGDGRIEYYGEVIPARPDHAIPAQPVTVVRCIECGGHTVIRHEFTSLRQKVDDRVAGLDAGQLAATT